MFADLITTAQQLAGLQAACDAYNASLQPTQDADGNEVPPVPLSSAEYWDRVYADVSASQPDEQAVFSRAAASYIIQHGVAA